MPRVLLLLLCICYCSDAFAARPPLRFPDAPREELERLPRGYAALEPAASPQPPLQSARALLSAAASTGDARLAARAQAILDGMRTGRDAPEALRLRAFSAQHRHDFNGALALLDRLVAQDPRDADARMSRAQIHLVQGKLALARADCAALALGVDSGDGMLCAAALSLRLDKLSVAAMLADRWLASVPAGDPRRRYVLILRAEAAGRARAADADSLFHEALALDRDDVRTLAAYSRYLRASARPQQALKLLARAPGSDGIQLERALAAHAARSPDAGELADAQGRRYALAHQLGSTPELRDEAEYWLTLRGQPRPALVLAQRNFRSQRDREDVDVLSRAATAAGRKDVLDALARWAQLSQLPAPVPGPAK